MDDIQRVARRYLHPDQLTIVLVGDARVFAGQLAGVGFDQVERIPVDQLDLSSPDLRRRSADPGRLHPAAYQVPAPAAAAKVDPLRAIVTRAVRAKGGVERLRSIRTIRTTSVTTVEIGDRRVEIPTDTVIRYPGSYRLDARGPDGELVQVFDRGAYWVKDADGVQAAAPAVADEIRASIQRDIIPLLLALYDRKVPARRLPDLVENGRRLVPVEVTLPDAPPVTLLFDADTALVAKMRYLAAGQPSGRVRVEESFSDYRDVKGLQVAFEASVRRERAPNVERVLRAFDINVPVDASLFTKPS